MESQKDLNKNRDSPLKTCEGHIITAMQLLYHKKRL